MDDFVDASQRYRDWRKTELNYYRNVYNDGENNIQIEMNLNLVNGILREQIQHISILRELNHRILIISIRMLFMISTEIVVIIWIGMTLLISSNEMN